MDQEGESPRAELGPPLEEASSSDQESESPRVELGPPLGQTGINWDQEQWMDAPVELRHVSELYSKGMNIFGKVAGQAYDLGMRCGTEIRGIEPPTTSDTLLTGEYRKARFGVRRIPQTTTASASASSIVTRNADRRPTGGR